MTLTVANLTEVPEGLDRAAAPRHSMISTHIVLRADGGRLLSPLEAGLASVNTYPVLASEDDDVIVGAAILPDHPRLAPEGLGSLFARDLPREAAVMDFGTGGLDLDAAVDVVIGTLDELVAQRG